MDITQEKTADLGATVKIKITPMDYLSNFEKEIKKVAKTASIPGFRPGAVPKSMLHKMYGKSILFDEVNKLVGQSLQNFIKENNLQVLGDPLPQPINQFDINIENPLEYDFAFDLGIAPEINISIPETAIPYYKITVEDSRVQDALQDLQERNGGFLSPEVSDADCILYGDFTELDEAGNHKSDGLKNTTTLMISLIKDEAVKAKFIGIEKGAVIVFNPESALQNETELGIMLNMPKENAAEVKSDFRFVVDSIGKRNKAELNQELFDKLYGKDAITTVEELTAKVREEIQQSFNMESDRKLRHDLEDVFLDKLNLPLPDEFLKRWLKTVSEKPLTDEILEKEYPIYTRGIKLRLIENKIMKEQNLQIEEAETRAMASNMLQQQFQQYGVSASMLGSMDKLVDKYLEKEENWNRVIEALQNFKAFAFLQAQVNKEEKNVTVDEFVKIINEHSHAHDH